MDPFFYIAGHPVLVTVVRALKYVNEVLAHESRCSILQELQDDSQVDPDNV